MELRIKTIQDFLDKLNIDFIYSGDSELIVETFSSLHNVKNSSVTWMKKLNAEQLDNLCNKEKVLVVCCKDQICDAYPDLNFLFCKNPKQVFLVY